MDIVENLFASCKDLESFLMKTGEISLKVYADENLRKNLLLASASFFEKEITNLVTDFTSAVSGNNPRIVSFVQKKAISRQYHTYFDWNKKNCNAFLALFGDEFKESFNEVILAENDVSAGAEAFMEIGSERNRMVHQDFGQYSLEKTTEEIIDLHRKAVVFVSRLKLCLME